MRGLLIFLLALNWTSLQSRSVEKTLQNDPSQQKHEGTANKTKNKAPPASEVNSATSNAEAVHQTQRHQNQSDNAIQRVEITPQPFAVAPQPTDTWIKWYVGFTAVIAIFSIVAALASIKQAYATRQKERAWLIAYIENPPQSLIGPQPDEIPISNEPGEVIVVTNIYRFGCKIENKGNSPARLTARAERLLVVPALDNWADELPKTPDYGPVTDLADYEVAICHQTPRYQFLFLCLRKMLRGLSRALTPCISMDL